MPSLSAESVSIRLLLGGLTALTALSIDICLPALPTIAAALGRDPEAAQLILTGYLGGFAAGQLVVGPLSDRFGRRPVLLGGLALFTIAALGCGFAGSIEQLTTLRILQGLGGSVGPVLGRTVVRDLFDREDGARVLSYVLMAMTAAPILAPILGVGILAVAGWRTIFLGLAVYGLLATAIVTFFLSETNRRPDPTATRPGRIAANWRVFLGSRTGTVNALVIGFTFGGMFAYISGSPAVVIDVFGQPEWVQAAVFAGTSAMLLVGSLISGRLVARHGVGRMLAAGQSLVGAGAAITMVAALSDWGLGPIVLGVGVYVLGGGLTFPNATALAMQPHPGMAGVAASLLGFVQMACGALASVAVMAFYDGTALAMAAVMAAGAVASLLVHAARERPYATAAGD